MSSAFSLEKIQWDDFNEFGYDGLEYLAGLICHKMKTLHSGLSANEAATTGPRRII